MTLGGRGAGGGGAHYFCWYCSPPRESISHRLPPSLDCTHVEPLVRGGNRHQVPLLLSMGENDLGLKKAILSGEDDLVYLSVRHIEQEAGTSEKGREAFCELMHAHPEALRLLKVTRMARMLEGRDGRRDKEYGRGERGEGRGGGGVRVVVFFPSLDPHPPLC